MPTWGDLLIGCTALAVPKTTLTKLKTSKIRYIFLKGYCTVFQHALKSLEITASV